MFKAVITEEFVDDHSVYNLHWTEIKHESNRIAWPLPRALHACISFKNRFLITIGGETYLNAHERGRSSKKSSPAKVPTMKSSNMSDDLLMDDEDQKEPH